MRTFPTFMFLVGIIDTLKDLWTVVFFIKKEI